MGRKPKIPLQELQAVVKQYGCKFDEENSLIFMARVREAGLLTDDEWKKVLRWLEEAITCLKRDELKNGENALNADADPRNADWIRIVRAQRLAGFYLPGWASLWLWWIGHDREHADFWKGIGDVARAMGFPRFREKLR